MIIIAESSVQPATPLVLLHADLEARAQAIRENRPEWPCRAGCGQCCRQLAAVPQLKAAEWALLQAGLATLRPEALREIRQRVAALAGQNTRPVTCPFLDQTANACLVYAQRPVACRAYGFYVQRDLGLYCHDIESLVATGALVEVVWGNYDAIERRLAGLGETRALSEWFDE